MALSPPHAPSDALPGARVRVWDPLVRLTHWSVAVAVLLNAVLLDEESAAHVWIGYAALGLVALRLLWGAVGPGTARFSAFPPSVPAALAHVRDTLAGRARPHLSHNPLGALMAYLLWASLLAVCLSGILMTTDRFWGVEWAEELHEGASTWLLACAALHVAGVAVETRLSRVNLVGAMITGVKILPDDRREGAA
jgi:cytochrome b